MKKIICAILLAVVVLSVVSCANSGVQVPNGMKLASEDGDIYYLFVPNAWTVDRGYGYPYAYISSSDASNVTVMFYMLKEEAVGTTAEGENPRDPYLDEYIKEFKAEADTSLPAFRIEEEVPATFGTYHARQIVYSHKSGDTVYRHRAIVTYYGEMIVVLTYTSTADNYDSHAVDVDKIIAEFKFKQ